MNNKFFYVFIFQNEKTTTWIFEKAQLNVYDEIAL